jgi:uncharacterized protein (TIGR02271 family)
MMFDLQRASLLPFSIYNPGARTNGATHRTNTGVEVIPVGEERLNVGTRVVQGETVRVTRRVVEQPVEQDVLLRDEKVIIERRPVPAGTAANGAKVLTETVVEMSNSSQVPTVSKSVYVGEEVVLRRQVTERTQRVRETLRRDVIDVQQERAEVPAPRAPALAYDTEAATQRAAQAENAKGPVEAREAVKQADKAASQDNGPRKN